MVVKYCPTCKNHEYQDAKYGHKQRACNVNAKNEPKCTVCDTVIKPEIKKMDKK